ncbi:MAG: hypothetical protein JWQ61_636 [Collimonas fungivorans]|uniref:NHL repeat-containing protein n=1 Tax=Collimonas fungivorans TaxID=158899 RepID=UPI0026F181CB|nr:NHL repeat-containing protein [Collimonas fungivorans]MDB5765822.1 hypothetical protein [Collimonas fungivorans]
MAPFRKCLRGEPPIINQGDWVKNRYLKLALMTSTITLLAACGGGGDSSGSPSPVVNPSPTVAANVTTLAGSGNPGRADAIGVAASFFNVNGVAADASGNVYVGDTGNNLIRVIAPSGAVTTLAGSGTAGSVNGTGAAASFNGPSGIAVDVSGNVYVADTTNNLIRKVTPGGVVTTLAGSGATGSMNGAGSAASFSLPTGVAVNAAGNVYVADGGNNLIRMITPAGMVTTVAGNLTRGSADGAGAAASFSVPAGVALDASGNLYVADRMGSLIRKVTSAGLVTTLAGNGSFDSKDGVGSAASFSQPNSVAVDTQGNVYVADTGNRLIRMITPAGVVTTLAGNSQAGSVNGAGTAASFTATVGVTADAAGNLYVADRNVIRKISK